MAKRESSYNYNPIAPEDRFNYTSQIIDEAEEEVTVDNALPPVEIRDPQQVRRERQQQFRDAYTKLEMLHQELSEFSVVHHYFKQSTKEGWITRLELAMADLKFFLPKDFPSRV